MLQHSLCTNFSITIVTVGDVGVGKTSLLKRFALGKFEEVPTTTIGLDFLKREVVIDNETIEVKVCDTAGQERFRTITSGYYREAHGVLVIYDISDESSFNNVNRWVQDLERFANENINIMIIGNKMDDMRRQVETEHGKKHAELKNIPFMETSAKTSENVDEAFLMFIKQIVERVKLEGNNSNSGIVDLNIHKSENNNKKNCPC